MFDKNKKYLRVDVYRGGDELCDMWVGNRGKSHQCSNCEGKV